MTGRLVFTGIMLFIGLQGLSAQAEQADTLALGSIPTSLSLREIGGTNDKIISARSYAFINSLERIEMSSKQTQAAISIAHDRPRHSSKKAMLWAILPGGGQIYNRKYWKVPIVWGTMMACFYAIDWNQRHYDEYHAAYRDIRSADPSKNTAWLDFAPRGTKPEDYKQMEHLASTLKRGNDYFRRYRDLSIVVGIVAYGASILDAYVDAELYTFDISPDLSLRVSPSILPTLPHQPSYQMGVMCSLTF
ncbi:MAG: DUF5683 domain-containing protein [Porphyromonadaceae bacterium]|nr:DUF5683 domain-containing protein [Porphyromonadaceae bacterium]